MEITFKDLRDIINIKEQADPDACPWKVGKNYFIRTVTHHLTGKLIAVHRNELVLTQAAWIADDGRFADALKTETFNEIEPFPENREVIVNRQSLVDAVELNSLPTRQK